MTYASNAHSQRFSDRFYVSETLTPEYIAAIYLLTSYEDLWEIAKSGITTSIIDFSKMDLQGLRPKAYVIYSAAKDISLEDYIDFERFGRDIIAEENGLFIENKGYVGLLQGFTLDEIISQDEDGDMTMI